MAIDYNELEQKLAKMKPRQLLYELVKNEMVKRGHWKQLPRNKGDASRFTKSKNAE